MKGKLTKTLIEHIDHKLKVFLEEDRLFFGLSFIFR